MAITLSRYLRLRIDSNLTANARYNLEKLDALGSTFIVDTSSNLNIRSESDITIEPQSADIGGSGTGGSLSFGTSSHSLDSINFYASSLNFSVGPGLLDTATGGTQYLRLSYKSDISGSTDTSSDRTLLLDLNGANRSLVLGGDYRQLGGSLTLNLPSDLAYTYPSGYGTPGQVWAGDGSGGWIWTDMSGGGGGGGDVSGYSTTWITGDGTTKIVTHSLNSNDIEIAIYDESSELMTVDSVVLTSSNSITLISSEAPASSWRVVVQAKQ